VTQPQFLQAFGKDYNRDYPPGLPLGLQGAMHRMSAVIILNITDPFFPVSYWWFSRQQYRRSGMSLRGEAFTTIPGRGSHYQLGKPSLCDCGAAIFLTQRGQIDGFGQAITRVAGHYHVVEDRWHRSP
jgi:hypothetical protein